MYTTVQEIDGEYYGVARSDGETTLYRSPGYVTKRMAESAAKCWVAFHGGEQDMTAMDDAVEAYRNMRKVQAECHAKDGYAAAPKHPEWAAAWGEYIRTLNAAGKAAGAPEKRRINPSTGKLMVGYPSRAVYNEVIRLSNA